MRPIYWLATVLVVVVCGVNWLQSYVMHDLQKRHSEQNAESDKRLAEARYGHPCGLGINREGYARLQQGMDKREADCTIGFDALEQSQAGAVIVYRWASSDKWIEAGFVNDRLVSKSQTGL